jgi:hypothetical protein
MPAGDMSRDDVQRFSTEPSSEESAGAGSRAVDVLVVTALQDELLALLDLGEDGRPGWRELRDLGGFWHVVGLCRFEPGELDPYLPEPLLLPDDASFLTLPPAKSRRG